MIATASAFVVTLSLIVASFGTKFTCSPLKMKQCEHDRFKNVTYPTVFGQTETKATRIISRLLPLIPEANKDCAQAMRNFLCALYAPPCVPNIGVAMPPCRHVCQTAARCQELTAKSSFAWRDEWKCADFPSEDEMCMDYKGHYKVYVTEEDSSKEEGSSAYDERGGSIRTTQDGTSSTLISSTLNYAKLTGNAPMIKQNAATPASLLNEKPRSDIKPRRYDISDMGSSKLFRGWVDVQGQGAANDYCRVIAARNRRKQFLACTLAGSTDNAVPFVSKRGFDAGHRNSWFMRDMDGDGRDDYCRCVGRGVRSKIYCMKTGLHGFYGGPLQPGSSEYTFIVPTPGPCLDKRINPFIGI